MDNYLAQSLKEITKEKEENFGEYPACPSCGSAMVGSFALPYKEWVCAPCGTGLPMFNGETKLCRSIKYMDAKKSRWSKELSIICRRIGGGQCAVKGCENGSCDYCKRAADKNYKFIYWKKNIAQDAINNHN